MPPGWRSLVKKAASWRRSTPSRVALKRPIGRAGSTAACGIAIRSPTAMIRALFFATVEPHVASAAGVIAAARIEGPRC